MQRVFTKTASGVPSDFFAAEARGLDRLRVAGGPPIPQVVEVERDRLVLEWIEPGSPGVAAAREFGRALVAVHRSGASSFGAAEDGYIATLRQDNSQCDDWPEFYAERRLRPMLREASDRGGVTAADRAAIEQLIDRLADLAGPAERPALIHGDLWSGNVHWATDGRVWLIDAASVHDGHRETDLAMLALFGAPYLDEILASYDETSRLADGWRERVPLHQVFPLLVHAALFGGGYGARAADAARRAMMAQ
jgi:fructosamine-3-kinase